MTHPSTPWLKVLLYAGVDGGVALAAAARPPGMPGPNLLVSPETWQAFLLTLRA